MKGTTIDAACDVLRKDGAGTRMHTTMNAFTSRFEKAPICTDTGALGLTPSYTSQGSAPSLSMGVMYDWKESNI